MAVKRRHAILVWDESGKVFDTICRTAIAVSLWRVSGKLAGSDLEEVDLAVAALYRSGGWRSFVIFVRRTCTVIVCATSARRDACGGLASGVLCCLLLCV